MSLETQSCFGRCTVGPNVLVREIPDGGEAPRGFATLPGPRGVTALYKRVDVARVHRIVDAHIVGGRVVREFIEKPPASLPVVSAAPEPTSTTTVESISPLLVPSDSGDRNA